MLKILTIAGSDSGGGAGIQADIKTVAAHGMYAMSVITVLTAQNTTGVFAIHEATPELIGLQMDAVFPDIFPDAVKIGMVSNAAIIKIVAQKLKYYRAKNIVVDPVMAAASGSRLLSDNSCEVLKNELFPLARVVTPNIPESEELCGFTIDGEAGMLRAAQSINGGGSYAVLVKGGHNKYNADDLLYAGGEARWFRGMRIDNPNTHGTGCTLSSAIACRLAEGRPLDDCVLYAKEYLTGAIGAMMDLGAGAGPLDHMYKTMG
jgi:hydroxymethylpyrimidine/phosphomethylpyrimidine kinase